MSDKSIRQAFHDARDGIENEQDIPKGNDHTIARKDNVEFPIPPPRYTGFSRPDLAPRGMIGVRQEQNSRPSHKLEMSGAPPRKPPKDPPDITLGDDKSERRAGLTPIFNRAAKKVDKEKGLNEQSQTLETKERYKIGDKGKMRREFARAAQLPLEKRRKIGVHDKEEKLTKTFNRAKERGPDRSR